MELGEKLRQARLEAGLTQRQLCGEGITRNMLSLIENGGASPSIKTLRYLSRRLGKPVSYFLEEQALVSVNQPVMQLARHRWDQGDWAAVAAALEGYQGPDPVYDRERNLLWAESHLHLAQQALEQGKLPYAQALLEKVDCRGLYAGEDLERRRRLLLGQLPGQQVSQRLPSLDAELLLRAGEALMQGQTERAGKLLDAAEDPDSPDWAALRGEVYRRSGDYARALECYRRAEQTVQILTGMEQCCRELGDYKGAYEAACQLRQRKERSR